MTLSWALIIHQSFGQQLKQQSVWKPSDRKCVINSGDRAILCSKTDGRKKLSLLSNFKKRILLHVNWLYFKQAFPRFSSHLKTTIYFTQRNKTKWFSTKGNNNRCYHYESHIWTNGLTIGKNVSQGSPWFCFLGSEHLQNVKSWECGQLFYVNENYLNKDQRVKIIPCHCHPTS